MTIRELEKAIEKTSRQLDCLRKQLQTREQTRMMPCEYCGCRSQRKNMKLHLHLYDVPSYGPCGMRGGYTKESCALTICPKCGKGTRYYEKGWRERVGEADWYGETSRGYESPVAWRNASWNQSSRATRAGAST